MPVDADTVFQLASCAKPLTATALATLVGAGRLRWDDRVIDHVGLGSPHRPRLHELPVHRGRRGRSPGGRHQLTFNLPDEAGDTQTDVLFTLDADGRAVRMLILQLDANWLGTFGRIP